MVYYRALVLKPIQKCWHILPGQSVDYVFSSHLEPGDVAPVAWGLRHQSQVATYLKLSISITSIHSMQPVHSSL
jgi:hypothetical protein